MLHIKNFIFKYRKMIFIFAAFLVLFAASFSSSFYHQTLIRVTSVNNTFTKVKEGFNGQKENCYNQNITARIRNGSHRGKTVNFSHDFSYSETLSDEYHPGDQIFVKLKENSDGSLGVSLLYDKRDSYLFLFIGIFILLLLFLFQKKGFLTLLSAGVNGLFFFLCLSFYKTDAFFDWIWILEVLFFVTVTLLFVSGIHRKTLGAILSSLLTVFLVTILYYFTVYADEDIPYEMLPNMVPNLPLYKVFLISTVLGLLGAVMDIAITMNASIHEIICASDRVTLSAAIKSVFEIGHDTMGTMVSVMFFSYLSGSFPLIVLKFTNNYTIDTLFSIDYVFDMIRFLISSIGIVLAIPISGFVAIILFRKGLVREN